jgi:excisionase family DNA binding protein
MAAVPVAEAARLLGVDARTIRRMCAEGRLESFATPGGHRRIALADIEAIRVGNSDRRFSGGYLGSPTVQQKKESIEELNLTLQEKKARMALRELEDAERERTDQEEAERQAQEQEARRARLDRDVEKAHRDRERALAHAEAVAVQERQEWEAQWLRDMLRRLPPDVPSEFRLEAAEAIRQELSALYQTSAGHAEDIVEMTLLAAVEKTLRPWRRGKEAEKAAEEAVKQLPPFAKSFFQPSEWELRAKEQALSAITALPETATFAQMAAAARATGQQIAQEYEHKEKCASATAEARRSLAGRLPFSTSQARAKAENAVGAAFGALHVGASSWDFDTARDAALAPFVAAEAQARAEHEAKQARARLDAEADRHLGRVYYYLSELQEDPDGWDFEGRLWEYSKEIAADIKADLMEDLPLGSIAGQQRVEELVDEWLAAHWKPPDAGRE